MAMRSKCAVVAAGVIALVLTVWWVSPRPARDQAGAVPPPRPRLADNVRKVSPTPTPDQLIKPPPGFVPPPLPLPLLGPVPAPSGELPPLPPGGFVPPPPPRPKSLVGDGR
jgi:hypothetical protein